MTRISESYFNPQEYLPSRAKSAIHETLGRLDMPLDSYFVLGGANMVLRGIKRYTTDLDVLVSDEMFDLLQFVDGAEIKEPPKPAIARGATNTTVWVKNSSTPIPLSATTSLGDGYFPMSFESHKDTVEIVEGVPCVTVDDIIEAKRALMRPKDVLDLRDIGRHIGQVIELPTQALVTSPFIS